MLVKRHGDAAILALDGLTTGQTGEGGVEPTTVQKQDGLLLFFQA